MKKLLIAALFAVTCITSAFAAGTEVNASALSAFKSQFKKASDVNWTSGEGFSKATFVLNNEKMEAFYSPDGDMIGTSKAITLDELSVKAKRDFSKKFGSYTVKEAIRFEGAEEGAYYISAANEKETVIVKVDDANYVSVVKISKK